MTQQPYEQPTGQPDGQPRPVRRLTRSRDDQMIAGVCGGIARYAGLDPTLVRVLAVIAAIFAFPGALIGYVVAWAIMPQE